MAYIDVVTLDDAKTYLRIDDTLTEDDAQITSMINTACRIVERRTNYMLYARSKSYLFQNFTVFVYDYPINSVTLPVDVDREDYEMYSIFEAQSSSDTTLTLNVGYSDPADVPDDLKNIVLNMVKFWYYEAETNESKKSALPLFVEQALDMNKRFII